MIGRLKCKSEFARNVLTLMTGAAVAQAIPVAISPILTRLYTPEDFGVLALFVAIATIFGSIASGRYERAIILPKKDEEAINIFVLGVIITTALSLMLLITAVLFNDYFVALLGNNEIGVWLYFIPIAVFFTGVFNGLNYFNNRRKNYKDIRNATIIKSVVLATAQLSIGVVKQGASGLISGQVLSQAAANTRLLRNILKEKKLLSKISKLKILVLAKRYRDFPIHNMPSAIADTATLQMPFIIFPLLFSITTGGFFMLSKRIIAMPSSLIANAISQVFFQTLADRKKQGVKCRPLLNNTLIKLAAIALPVAIVIYLTSPFLFKIVFGEQWKIAGEIAQYLAGIFFITFVVSSVSVVFAVSGHIKRGAMWKYTYFITTGFLFGASYLFKLDVMTFFKFFVIHEYILYSFYLCLIIKSVNQMDERIKL